MENKLVTENDEMTIVLVGPTGSGKTSTINSIISQLVSPNFLEPRAIAIGKRISIMGADGSPVEMELGCNIPSFKRCQSENVSSNLVESQTRDTNKYSVRFDNLTISLIDTPGITDTKGRSQEEANAEEWVRGLNKVGSFNIIALVVKASENRIDASTQKMVAILKTLLPEKYKNNIVVFLTHFTNRSAIRSLEILKFMEVPFEQVFYFENSCILSVGDFFKNMHPSPDEVEEMNSILSKFWKLNHENTKKVLQTARKMVPQSVIHITNIRCQINHLKFVIAQLYCSSIDLMISLNELKKLANEKTLTIKNLSQIEKEISQAQSKCSEHESLLTSKDEEQALTGKIIAGIEVGIRLIDIIIKFRPFNNEKVESTILIVSSSLRWIFSFVTHCLSIDEKTLQRNLADARAEMRKSLDEYASAQSKDERISSQIEVINQSQTEIIKKVQNMCRCAIYLFIKANSALIQSNTSKSYFLEQVDEELKKLETNNQIVDSLKEATATVIRYMKEAFEDYEENYGPEKIDSFIDSDMRIKITEKIREQALGYFTNVEPSNDETLIIDKPCGLI